MSLIYYRPPQNIIAEKLQFVIESEIPGLQMEIFYSIEGLSERLSQSARGNCAAVILAENINDLKNVFTLKNLLKDIRIILILPDRTDEVISMGHKLRPRFLSYMDSEIMEVAVVLKRMVKLMGENTCTNCTINPGLN